MLINFDLLSVGTTVFEQFPGLRFPGTPRIIQPSMSTASGTQALSNAQPGEEFNTQPLVVEFSAPQTFVRMHAGLNISSSAPVEAVLRAYDAADTVIAQNGPIPIGPGPTGILTLMQVEVAEPSIRRVELEYSGAFAEVIDDLEFEVIGPVVPPDTEAPTVTIIQPADGADLTGDMFILEAEIQEERKLRLVSISIENDEGIQLFELSFSGVGPDYRVGPTFTGFLADEINTIVLSAEDFGGNIGTASISVNRVPIEGRLVLPEEPIEIPRIPRNAVILVELQETFPGSLNGRGEIIIRVVGPEDIRGFDRIRDFLTQPVPRLDFEVFAGPRSRLGPASIALQAIEVASGRILDTAAFPASITPGRSIACGTSIPVYTAIDLTELTTEVNTRVDIALSERDDTEKLSDMTVLYGNGRLKLSQRYRAEKFGISANINFYGELTFTPNPPTIDVEYAIYHVNADPNIPVVDPIITPSAYVAAQKLFQDRFTDAFRERFRNDLGNGLIERIEAVNDALPLLLRDIFINPKEFGLGFCVPGSVLGGFIPLLSNDFSEDPLADPEFEIVDDPQASIGAPSNWSYNETEQRIDQLSNIHGPANHVNTNPNKPGTYLVGLATVEDEETGEDIPGPWPELRDMVLVCHLNSGDNDGIGVVFRYQDPDNFYLFLMDAQRNYRRIGKKIGGIFQELEVPALDTTEGYNLNQDYELTLIAGRSSPYIGEVFKVYLDGVEILSGRDRSLAQPGRVGFYAWGNTSARFLDLTVHPGGLIFNPATF